MKEAGFEDLAMEIFHFQFHQNEVYRSFSALLNKTPDTVKNFRDIPFLPIRFFKSHPVASGGFEPQIIFQSSGTTGMERSMHRVKDVSLYRDSFLKAFELFYGAPGNWSVLGLLPSYLEQGNSSLVFMVEELIRRSGNPLSGFYLYDHEKLGQVIKKNEATGTKTLLIGVTYALLDFAASFQQPLSHTVIMETGGMKGRKKELTRQEVHARLKEAFGVPVIHSEYGMTELLSQAYAKSEGRFFTPPWMKISMRDEEDPLMTTQHNSGLINITDLANVYSCSFIATDDVGRINNDGSFEVMGRVDNADLRGCSLMVAI